MRLNKQTPLLFALVGFLFIVVACSVMRPGSTPFTPDTYEPGTLITLPDGSVILAEDLTEDQMFDFISQWSNGEVTTAQFQRMIDDERERNPEAPWPEIFWAVGGYALTRKALAHIPLINRITPMLAGVHPLLGIFSSLFASGTGFRTPTTN